MAFGVLRARKNLFERGYLSGAEAGGVFLSPARQRPKFRFYKGGFAGGEIGDDAIGQAVQPVASREDGAGDQSQIRVGESLVHEGLSDRVPEAGGLRDFGKGLCIPGFGDSGFREFEAGRAGEDAVEVVRETLRHHHGFASAFGTADEVRAVGRFAVVDPEESFGGLSDLIVGVVTEVEAGLLVEAEGQGTVEFRIVINGVIVPGVLGDNGVSESQGVGGLLALQISQRIADVAIRPSPSFEEEPSVPVGWEAQVETDGVVLPVGAGPVVHSTEDFAVGRQRGNRAAAPASGPRDGRGRRFQSRGRDDGCGVGELRAVHGCERGTLVVVLCSAFLGHTSMDENEQARGDPVSGFVWHVVAGTPHYHTMAGWSGFLQRLRCQ